MVTAGEATPGNRGRMSDISRLLHQVIPAWIPLLWKCTGPVLQSLYRDVTRDHHGRMLDFEFGTRLLA